MPRQEFCKIAPDDDLTDRWLVNLTTKTVYHVVAATGDRLLVKTSVGMASISRAEAAATLRLVD